MRLGLVIATLVLAADQIGKWWMLTRVMDPPRVIEVTPFFNLVMVWNRGVSFGLFASDSDTGRWVLIGLSLAVTAGLVVWLRQLETRLDRLALGLVIGGALGNVIDRIVRGAVADFFDFYAAGYHWPAFNLADVGISIGVGLLLFSALFEPAKRTTL